MSEAKQAVVDGLVAYGAAFGVVAILMTMQLSTHARPPTFLLQGAPALALLITVFVRQRRLLGSPSLFYRSARLWVSLSAPAAAFSLCIMGAPHMLVAFFPVAATTVGIALLGLALLHFASKTSEREARAPRPPN